MNFPYYEASIRALMLKNITYSHPVSSPSQLLFIAYTSEILLEMRTCLCKKMDAEVDVFNVMCKASNDSLSCDKGELTSAEYR